MVVDVLAKAQYHGGGHSVERCEVRKSEVFSFP